MTSDSTSCGQLEKFFFNMMMRNSALPGNKELMSFLDHLVTFNSSQEYYDSASFYMHCNEFRIQT